MLSICLLPCKTESAPATHKVTVRIKQERCETLAEKKKREREIHMLDSLSVLVKGIKAALSISR